MGKLSGKLSGNLIGECNGKLGHLPVSDKIRPGAKSQQSLTCGFDILSYPKNGYDAVSQAFSGSGPL